MGSIFRIPLGLSITIDKDYTAVIGQRAYERIELVETRLLWIIRLDDHRATQHACGNSGNSV
jgi:hypothetical protein